MKRMIKRGEHNIVIKQTPNVNPKHTNTDHTSKAKLILFPTYTPQPSTPIKHAGSELLIVEG
jgi:hypothetical protein